jgi:putative tributyrin esterase
MLPLPQKRMEPRPPDPRAGWVLLWLLLLGPALPALGSPPPAAPAFTVECHDVPSAILARPVPTCVALPPGYASTAPRRYPVLYYLHGLFENEHSWVNRGGEEILENLLSAGKVGPFIVVLPNGGRTFYVNSFDGQVRYEDFFIQELVPWVDRSYRTLADRRARGIAGDSMGGYGALHLSMRHPDIFASASAQSAALIAQLPDPLPTEGRWAFYKRVLEAPFGDPINRQYFQENNPLRLAEHPERFENLKLYFDCGTDDRFGFEEGAARLDQILTSKGFPHEYYLREGGHGWDYLLQYMQYALIFQWKNFAAAEALAAGGGNAPEMLRFAPWFQ